MTQDEFRKRYRYDTAKDILGEGGFGSVFKAYDTYRDRWIALKIAKVQPGRENVRLKKEVEMVSALRPHPNIAYYEECYTFPSHDGEDDIGVLQYYEEGNLIQLLRKQTLSFGEIYSILRQVLSGLEFLHGQEPGIIHRDLKPQNILMVKRHDGEYVPKITDFGISKELDVDKSSIFTNSLVGAGTLAYASPEQLKEKDIRRNADLWSFGVIAYQALTGELPFNTGEHSPTSELGRGELFRQIREGQIPDRINQIAEPWQGLIRRCLVADPDKRIKHASECLELLGVLSDSIGSPKEKPILDDVKTRIGAGAKANEKAGTGLPPPGERDGGKGAMPKAISEKPVLLSGNNSKKGLIVFFSTAAALLIVLIMIVAPWNLGKESAPVSVYEGLIPAPDVASMTLSAAETAIKSAGLEVGSVMDIKSDDVPAGRVISQNPASGISVARGTPVSLQVSIGPEKVQKAPGSAPQVQKTGGAQPTRVSVPNMYNMSREAAESAIRSAGLSVGPAMSENHATVPSGRVIASNPAPGTSVTQGAAVALRLSSGPDVKAMYELGRNYYYGRGVAQNYSEAVKWLRLAADQGYAPAQRNLGLCYAYGRGVTQNKSEAVRWMRLAANQGNEDARRWLNANQ